MDAVIFDAEGVVIDTEECWNKTDTTVLDSFGIAYDITKVKPLLSGRSLLEGSQVLVKHYGLPVTAQDLCDKRFAVMSGLLKNIRFISGFENFFSSLSVPMAIGTAMQDDLLAIVEQQLNLKRLFNSHVYSVQSAGGKGKPAPDVYLYAANKLGIVPSRCVVIEDAPLGIAAAKTAGMRCIALTTTYPRELLHAADVIVDSYDELTRDFLQAHN